MNFFQFFLFFHIFFARFDDEDFIFSLIAGQDFGEIALLSDVSRRTCTIRAANNRTKLIEFSKEHFMAFISDFEAGTVKEYVRLFKESHLLKEVSERSLSVLASKTAIMKYPGRTVITSQGDKTYNVYFIKSGTVKLARSVKKSSLDVSDRGPIFQKKHYQLKDTLILDVETLRKLLSPSKNMILHQIF